MATMVGGYGPIRVANKETQEICHQVKTQVEKKTGVNYVEYTAVESRFQVVAGINYLIKVHVGGANYIHLEIFQEMRNGGKNSLTKVKDHQTKDSPLEPF
ncbi:cystatin-A1-like isoform X2 [Sander lucioperca]|uniref:Cystatin-B n=1 Tax=Sander lucioperca TaxID=283035 RepID=A0A8C9XAB4_SANLU|nr:cystatin-A1-like isoform X2 [Sander lucioperca]